MGQSHDMDQAFVEVKQSSWQGLGPELVLNFAEAPQILYKN